MEPILDDVEGSFWRHMVPRNVADVTKKTSKHIDWSLHDDNPMAVEGLDLGWHHESLGAGYRRISRSSPSIKDDDGDIKENNDTAESKSKSGRSAIWPMCYALALNFISPRIKTTRSPLFWAMVNLIIAAFFVWRLAGHYTKVDCVMHTEFINAGRIISNPHDVVYPSHLKSMASKRQGLNNKNYTFLSWDGQYPFMTKPNYKICASAMPQLICQCDHAEVCGTVQNIKIRSSLYLAR